MLDVPEAPPSQRNDTASSLQALTQPFLQVWTHAPKCEPRRWCPGLFQNHLVHHSPLCVGLSRFTLISQDSPRSVRVTPISHDNSRIDRVTLISQDSPRTVRVTLISQDSSRTVRVTLTSQDSPRTARVTLISQDSPRTVRVTLISHDSPRKGYCNIPG